MIYSGYQALADFTGPMRASSAVWMAALRSPWLSPFLHGPGRHALAMHEMVTRATLTHHRPAFGIDTVRSSGRDVAVFEEVTLSTSFGTLLHFRKEDPAPQPRVLVVAPLSGHFATLLRGTVQTLLADHDVYLTDWHNARDVAPGEGEFGMDAYTDHLVRFLEVIGPGAHLLAVCQPCVCALVATAVMAQSGNPAQPRSLILMAGPIDTRVNPTRVNELAVGRPIEWFERNLITTVPPGFRGAGRRVYPGFLQLAAFMSMNPQRHVNAHLDLYRHLVDGDLEKAEALRSFYDEYFAVLDLAAEFYLETVQQVFQEHALPTGQLCWHGERVEPRAIRRTTLLTVEGERDDICSLGQTLAAHELCSGLRPYRKRHHMQAGVGHYGVFSGRRWQQQIYPVVRNTILASE
jgi:polyhydroxyalkanoate depolymerase